MNKDTNPVLPISPDFIAMLGKEGDKAFATCQALNAEQAFTDAVASVAEEAHRAIVYRAEHILLHDIVRIFNEFAEPYEADKLPVKARFILIYLYERLQGKDLIAMYDLKTLNELTRSGMFGKNVSIIRTTSFFQPGKEVAKEFILPLILKKIKSEHFPAVTSLISRVASLIIKADGNISAREEELLKRITDKANNPKVTVAHARYSDVPESDSLEIVLAELKELIGLDDIKKNVEDLINFLKVQKMREEKGLKTSQNSLHAVFMGPPGTGKTTVARMLGRIFKHLGYLEKGHLVETDRAGMVAGYVGQTAIKADEIIKTAIGGVLFIDEAYSLTSGGFNDYGREAIEILLKRMEDQRDDLVVVVAGYPDEMQFFIQSNPGLQSRFNRYFSFDHFQSGDLMKIFKIIAKKADFVLTEDAEEKLNEILDRLYEKRHRGFGNARTVRNLFEKVIERQANRIVSIAPITEDILMTITEEDVPDVLKTVKEIMLFEEEDANKKIE